MPDLPLLVRPNQIKAILGIPLRSYYELMKSDPACPKFAQIGPRSVAFSGDDLPVYRGVLRRPRAGGGSRPPGASLIDPPKRRGRPPASRDHEGAATQS